VYCLTRNGIGFEGKTFSEILEKITGQPTDDKNITNG
jgi:hypothetical protein